MGAFSNGCVSFVNHTPFYDTSACNFLLMNAGYAVFNLSKRSFSFKATMSLGVHKVY